MIEDWTIITDRYVIDAGRLAIGPVTHTTRDGLPMSVQYDTRIGWLVGIDTDPSDA